MHQQSLEKVKAAQVRVAMLRGQMAAQREVRAYCVGKKIKEQEVSGRVEQLVSRLPVPAKQAISSKLCQLLNTNPNPGAIPMSNSILDRIPEPIRPPAIGLLSASIVGLILIGGSAAGGIKQQSPETWIGVIGIAGVTTSVGVWFAGQVRSPKRGGSQDYDDSTQYDYAPTHAHPTYTKLAIACGENLANKKPGPDFDRTLEVSERMLGHVREATSGHAIAPAYQTVAFTGYSAPQYLGEADERISGSPDPSERELPARPQFVLPQSEQPAIATPASTPAAEPLPNLELQQDPDLYEDAWGESATANESHPFQELYE